MNRMPFILFLILIGSALVFAGGSKETDSTEKKMESGPAMSAGPAVPGGSAMPASSFKTTFTDLHSARKLAEKGPAVLFFSATWCPSCRAANKDLNENGAALEKDISVIVVDYDSHSDIKKKYGITYQHTFVQIDGKGEAIKTWSGGGVAEINKNVKRKM